MSADSVAAAERHEEAAERPEQQPGRAGQQRARDERGAQHAREHDEAGRRGRAEAARPCRARRPRRSAARSRRPRTGRPGRRSGRRGGARQRGYGDRVVPVASIGSFFDSVGEFFANLARVDWLTLLLGMACFGIYLTLRSRAWFHVLRAAYPDEPFQWRKIWGAYFAAYGFNNVVPARGGDVMKLFLTRTSIPKSSYPAVGSSHVRRAGLRPRHRHPGPDLRLHPGRLPEAAGLPGHRRLRPVLLRVAPEGDAVRADGASACSCSSASRC